MFFISHLRKVVKSLMSRHPPPSILFRGSYFFVHFFLWWRVFLVVRLHKNIFFCVSSLREVIMGIYNLIITVCLNLVFMFSHNFYDFQFKYYHSSYLRCFPYPVRSHILYIQNIIFMHYSTTETTKWRKKFFYSIIFLSNCLNLQKAEMEEGGGGF